MTDFQDLFVISTSLILLLGAVAVLAIDIFFPNNRGWLSVTALSVLLIAIVGAFLQFSFGDTQIAFYGAVSLDQFGLFFITLVIIVAVIIGLLFGTFLGILSYKSKRLDSILKTIFDFMQTDQD